jgi:hypothetical protein
MVCAWIIYSCVVNCTVVDMWAQIYLSATAAQLKRIPMCMVVACAYVSVTAFVENSRLE